MTEWRSCEGDVAALRLRRHRVAFAPQSQGVYAVVASRLRLRRKAFVASSQGRDGVAQCPGPGKKRPKTLQDHIFFLFLQAKPIPDATTCTNFNHPLAASAFGLGAGESVRRDGLRRPRRRPHRRCGGHSACRGRLFGGGRRPGLLPHGPHVPGRPRGAQDQRGAPS